MLALKVRRLFDGDGALIGVISTIDVLGKLEAMASTTGRQPEG